MNNPRNKTAVPRASRHGLGLSETEISELFSDVNWAKSFPPILTVEQAAELLRVPKKTIYDWSSRGVLAGCSRKVGRHLRFLRNRLIEVLFNGEINNK